MSYAKYNLFCIHFFLKQYQITKKNIQVYENDLLKFKSQGFDCTINTFLNIVYITTLIYRITLLYLLIVLIKYLCKNTNKIIMTK